ncbi:unnamed protein product [Lactuca virosa]|uniref:non-specific serine/threonine protein kinase n=1 Tax=Lactuca virosa TaxID=75947 RepID=A0AAU9NER9_9ASTR|nr:unnamed protein product [Lactuca virosa]
MRMTLRKGYFLMLLHSLLYISSDSFTNSGFHPVDNIRNHDCSCFGNNHRWVDQHTKQVLTFGLVPSAVTGVILAMIILNIIVFKLSQLHETNDKKPPSFSQEHLCRWFPLTDMRVATNNFSQDMVIGKGGFGKVLCGRPAIDPTLGDNELGLVGWAMGFIKEGMLNHIIDPSLKGQVIPDCLEAFVGITEKCLKTRPKERPTMTEVVVELEAVLVMQEKANSFVLESCSRYENEEKGNSNVKSGKITVSRMLRSMFAVKTSATLVEQPEKKKGQSICLLPCTLSNKDDLLSNTTNSFHEVNFKREVINSRLKVFTVAGLKIATRNFSHDMIAGEGAFGKVFKGWVDHETFSPSKVASGMAVAVKKLNTDGYQGFQEWQAEVKILGRLSHPNLVHLIGYCCEDKDLFLIYEFLNKGSLENYILKKGSGLELPWSMRLKIMIGTAQGLAFLHSAENQIIFRDLKSSNILLDQDFNAKICDFGLAIHGPTNGNTHIMTEVMGTHGYVAPEYVATGHLNGKNDVYAFGVVLLESLTGLRAIDKTRPNKEQNLVEWIRPMLHSKRKVKTIIDPSLGHDYQLKAAYECAALVLRCTQPESIQRPSIEQVLQSLEGISGII